MDVDFGSLLLWLVVGATVATLLMMSMELATGEQFGFAFPDKQPAALMPIAIAIRAIAGPAIVARGAYCQHVGGRGDGVLPASMMVLALCWCLVTGWLLWMPMAGLV